MEQLCSQDNLKQTKREYIRVTNDMRQKLIYMVIDQHQGITSTAKKMNMKLSAAKAIISKFKRFRRQQIKQKNVLALKDSQKKFNRSIKEVHDKQLENQQNKPKNSQTQITRQSNPQIQFNLTPEYLIDALRSHFMFTVNIKFMNGVSELF